MQQQLNVAGEIIQNQEDGERKVTLTICTTPTELRAIADGTSHAINP